MGLFKKNKKSEHVSDYFSQDDLRAIRKEIHNIEDYTSAEVRVAIQMHCDKDLGGNIHKQAERKFYEAHMENTHNHTGVLILVVLGERKIAIYGDKAIHGKVPQTFWRYHVWLLASHFRQGRYTEGVCEIIQKVGTTLREHFPHNAGDTNQLSDEVIVKEGGR